MRVQRGASPRRVLAAADSPQEEREHACLVNAEEKDAEPRDGPREAPELGQHVGDPVVAAEVRERAEDQAIDEDPARRLVADRDQGGNERHPGQGVETEADESQDDQDR